VHGYTAQLAAFVDAMRTGSVTGPTGEDARNALAIALACIKSVSERRTVQLSSL
jgi:myo-inositol 2-dehydrogenase/D-chiro-inositol 1-dehydrogenase